MDEEGFFKERAGHRFRHNKKEEVTALSAHEYKKGSPYANTKGGLVPALGVKVRSGWEKNVLYILKDYGIDFKYEEQIFHFPIKKGNTAYRPDVYLPDTDEIIEIKGYFDNDSRIKLKRFAKFYPSEFKKLIMVVSKYSKPVNQFCNENGVPVLYYENLVKLYKDRIPGWE